MGQTRRQRKMVVGERLRLEAEPEAESSTRLRLCRCEAEGVPVMGVRIVIAGQYGNRRLEGIKSWKTLKCR